MLAAQPAWRRRQPTSRNNMGLVHGSSLGALFPSQAFYYDQEPVLSDSEFDNLKQELQWEGSKVVVLT